MEVRFSKNEDMLIARVDGELTIYHTAEFIDLMQSSMDAEIRAVTLDLEFVAAIDSSGIGALINIHSFSRENGVSLFLASVNAVVRGALDDVRLNAFFDMIDTIEETKQRISK